MGALKLQRPPRPSEIALLRELLKGPQSLAQGPVGRCAKRGWCQVDVNDDGNGRARARFRITEKGLSILATFAAQSGTQGGTPAVFRAGLSIGRPILTLVGSARKA